MGKLPPKPENEPWVSPYLIVRDADAAGAFYEKAFGFKTTFAMKGPDGRTGHMQMAWRGGQIMFGPEGPRQPTKSPATSGTPAPISMYVYCDDVDALFKQATAAGAKADKQPETMFYGHRVASLFDPDGYLWYFATVVAEFDPSKAPC